MRLYFKINNYFIKTSTILLFILLVSCRVAFANYILIPMDHSQKNHLKAYGIAYWVLQREGEVSWLLNYRGGSFMMKYNKSIEDEMVIRGVSYEIIADAQSTEILQEISSNDFQLNPEGRKTSLPLKKQKNYAPSPPPPPAPPPPPPRYDHSGQRLQKPSQSISCSVPNINHNFFGESRKIIFFRGFVYFLLMDPLRDFGAFWTKKNIFVKRVCSAQIKVVLQFSMATKF